MKNIIRKYLEKVLRRLATEDEKKYRAELNFWHGEIENYKQWFNGQLKESYGTMSPAEHEKVHAVNLKDSAILTWHKLHQERKYLSDLQLSEEAFRGKKILDIGSGPIPSATCFKDAELYCLEPLFSRYIDIGFPIHYYDNTRFIQSRAEDIPVSNHFFDAVISVNALDHVDDFEKCAAEITRILKPGGTLVLHLHYHLKTITEPVELNDERVRKAFHQIRDFKKISVKTHKFGTVCEEGESYVLWSNAPSDKFK